MTTLLTHSDAIAVIGASFLLAWYLRAMSLAIYSAAEATMELAENRLNTGSYDPAELASIKRQLDELEDSVSHRFNRVGGRISKLTKPGGEVGAEPIDPDDDQIDLEELIAIENGVQPAPRTPRRGRRRRRPRR